jgi:hypothetical protein
VIPTVVGACAAAFTGWRAVAAVLGISGLFAALRSTDAWEGRDVATSVEEGLVLAALGVAVVVAVRAVQVAASRVSTAEAEARDAHLRADAAAAAEREGARWDALIHDDVLSALSTAVHASTPDLAGRAGQEARRALDRIGADTGGSSSSADELLGRVSDAVRSVDPAAVVHVEVAPDARSLPREVADAVVDAVTEAVRNADRHAGDDALTQVHGSLTAHGVSMVVRDDGRGFVVADVAPSRLGLRVSVGGRLRSVGGGAAWTSEPGRGTRVDIWWPA